MTADTPDLTVAELEQIRDATLRTYEGGNEQYNTLPPHLLKVVDGDGGLIHMINLAIRRTRERDVYAAHISDLSALTHEYREALMAVIGRADETTVTNGGVDYTIVAPGALAKMLANDEDTMSPRFREAIARARQRRENHG